MINWEQTRFTLIRIGLILLIISGLSVCIIVRVLVSIEEPSVEQVTLFLSGLTIIVIGLIIIHKQNDSKKIAGELINGYEPFLAKWEINGEDWDRFLKVKLNMTLRNTVAIGVSLVIVLGLLIVPAFFIFENYKFDLAILGLIMIVIMVFFLCKSIARLKAEKLAEIKELQLYFTETSIIYNSQLILLNELGSVLKSFSIQTQKDINTLKVVLENGGDSCELKKRFILPVPSNKKEEAESLVEHYNKTIVN